jgi:hypothetical protein
MMTVQPDHASAVVPHCWCCGSDFSEAELVRLGNHPEVGVCLACANWLRRRAQQRHDEQHPSTTRHVRAAIHRVRNFVIEKGWHERGRLGALLHRLDRHLP